MIIALLLIPLGLVLMGLAAAALFWAVNGGQFDDLDTPGRSVLEEDAPEPPRAPAADAAGSAPVERP
jgi:cbb3-type cytochrome oxidase maturation protein